MKGIKEFMGDKLLLRTQEKRYLNLLERPEIPLKVRNLNENVKVALGR